jgi:hypothetical protein
MLIWGRAMKLAKIISMLAAIGCTVFISTAANAQAGSATYPLTVSATVQNSCTNTGSSLTLAFAAITGASTGATPTVAATSPITLACSLPPTVTLQSGGATLTSGGRTLAGTGTAAGKSLTYNVSLAVGTTAPATMPTAAFALSGTSTPAITGTSSVMVVGQLGASQAITAAGTYSETALSVNLSW